MNTVEDEMYPMTPWCGPGLWRGVVWALGIESGAVALFWAIWRLI